MGIISSNKVINTDVIGCDGQLQVTLAITAAPDIITNPTDIVLVLDRSGSMAGSPLENLKLGAKTFIGIIDESTDESGDGQIGNGSHIGIVSFAGEATQDTGLITSVAELDGVVDGLAATGNTNHGDAFEKAMDLFDPASTNGKVIVMFTDGETTEGPNPDPIAQAAKAQGITIYCIGLLGSSGVDLSNLNDWATAPATTHVAVTPDAADLETLFADLAANISKPGATNIVIDETISSQFVITDISGATKGTVDQVDPNNLEWTIDQLGTTSSETAELTFTVRYVGDIFGDQPVNSQITYSDTEGNVVNFPSPTVAVNCITPVIETCVASVPITADGCSDVIVVDAGELSMSSTGRILEMNMTLTGVCPNKRVALAVALVELDEEGVAYPRGMKSMTIPAHTLEGCQDILVECIKFVLPEDLNVSGQPGSCGVRNFRAQVLANYVDTGIVCCGLNQ